MKILLATGIYPPDAGGPATYTRGLARALVERGHEVEVVCYADPTEITNHKSQITKNIQYPVTRISRSLPLPFRYLAFAWKVFRRARAINADLVYLQGPVSEGFPGTIGAMLAGKPTVMKIVGDYAWEIYQGAFLESGETGELLYEFVTQRHRGKVGQLERIERWTAKRARRIITPSVYLQHIVQLWGVPKERISVIYNAISDFPSGKDRASFRAERGLEASRVVFTAVRAVPWKNIDFIISLLPDLPKEIILVIAGDGPCLEVWKAEVERLHLGERVRFEGRCDRGRVGEWYRAADLFVLPSGYEGFAHVIPEATSQGLPSFVSDQGGNPETQTLLGQSCVTVLPYLDRERWLAALRASWPERCHSALPDVLRFDVMVERTEDVLKQSL